MGLGRHQISLAGIPPKSTKEKAYSQSFNDLAVRLQLFVLVQEDRWDVT